MSASCPLGKIDRMAGNPEGFEYRVVGTDVVINHHGRRATTLRGPAAQRFLEDVESGDPQ